MGHLDSLIKMGTMNLILVYLCCLLPWTVVGKDYFTAAVFEHRPRALNTSLDDPLDIITSNLKVYERAIPLAVKKGVDIIVFNEYGLFLQVWNRNRLKQFMEPLPDPTKGKYNPCVDKNHNSFIFTHVSCLAREYNIYIVANFGDIQPCSDTCDAHKVKDCHSTCPDDGVKIYNTDVVFDREGNMVAKYHKTHPYFEYVNTPDEPQFVTFKTDFGHFGLITCFDSVWKEATMVAGNYGIDTLIYPHFWYDDLVPLKSVEWQQAWALENKVNLLAANTHRPGTASFGSGIYSKDSGAIVYTYDPDGESKLLIANVGNKGNKNVPELKTVIVVTDDSHYEKTIEDGSKFPEHCYFEEMGPPNKLYHDYRCFKSHTRAHSKTKLQTPSGTTEVCHREFCCSVTYSAEDMKEDFYLTAFAGENDVKGYFKWEEETCLLLRCDPLDNKPCIMQATTSNTVFKNVVMKAHFTAQRTYAAVTKSKFRLAPKTEWSYSKDSDVVTLKFESDSREPLLKVGLFGRKYDSDPPFIPWRPPFQVPLE